MSTDLAQVTIAGLFKELAEVEQAIRACNPTLTFDGVQTSVNAHLLDLAVQERRICEELARRRSALRQQRQARSEAMESATT
jgi:hypothetical protein